MEDWLKEVSQRVPANDDEALLAEAAALQLALDDGDFAGARERLNGMLAHYPTSWWAHLYAQAAYSQMGEPERAMAEAGVGLALEPTNSAAYRAVAQLLARAGHAEAARRVLENGWEHAKKLYRKWEWADERALYFALSDEELPPQLAERRRQRRAQIAEDLARMQDAAHEDSDTTSAAE